MLGPNAETDEPRWNTTQKCHAVDQAEHQRRVDRPLFPQHAGNYPSLNCHLQPLGHSGGELAPFLHPLQIFGCRAPSTQRFGEEVRRGHRVLNSEVYSYSADGRHGMRRVTNAEQTRTEPVQQAVNANGQEFYLFPTFQLANSGFFEWRHLHDFVAKRFEPSAPDFVELTFGNDVAALPVAPAVDSNENCAGIKASHGLRRIAGTARKTKPQYIHRRAEFFNRQAGPGAYHRSATVGRHDQISAHFERASRSFHLHTGDISVLFDHFGDLCLHYQMERGVARAVAREEIKKIPLRHESDKIA